MIPSHSLVEEGHNTNKNTGFSDQAAKTSESNFKLNVRLRNNKLLTKERSNEALLIADQMEDDSSLQLQRNPSRL